MYGEISKTNNHLLLSIIIASLLSILFTLNQSISIILLVFSIVLIFLLIRLDVAFYILILFYFTIIALPLNIDSPFTPGARADLPFYEVIAPLLFIILTTRIAIGKEKVPKSPLMVPIIVWFIFIFLTYVRNPLSLDDLFSKTGTGAIYHTVYPLFLCGMFYICAATIFNSEKRIKIAIKIVFSLMLVGMFLMILMLVIGWDIPLITGGRSPWQVMRMSHYGGIIYRIMAMSNYSALLLLTLLCFGLNIKKTLQIFISVILIFTLILGGGRSPLIMVFIFFVLSFILEPKSRWLITSLIIIMALSITLITLMDIRLPLTTSRITNFSPSAARIGAGGRMLMAKASLEVIKERPFVGYGYGSLWNYYSNSKKLTKQIVSGDPHSGLLSIMTSQGLVGLGFFLWLIITAIKTGWKLYIITEDGFLKQLMLWITLHIISLFILFFLVAQTEKDVLFYLEMGVISAVYTINANKQNLMDKSVVNCLDA